MYYESALTHHGIKGQKWGVRRFQNKDGSLTSAGKKRVQNRRVNSKVEDYIKSGKAYIENLEDYNVGSVKGLFEYAVGGSRFISALSNASDINKAEVTYYGDEGFKQPSAVIDEYKDAHKFASDDSINSWHSQGVLTSRDLEACNPGFGEPGTTQNCFKCSCALEMRLRGYDISAGRQSYPSSVNAASLWFKDAQRVDYDSDFAEEALRSYGTKTSGTLGIKFPGGNAGHAMHWTNDAYGRFSIQDGQNGRTFNSLKEMMDAYGADTNAKISTYRLDNCEPNLQMMSQDSVLRGAEYASRVGDRTTGEVRDKW